jgi:hypothetical protein
VCVCVCVWHSVWVYVFVCVCVTLRVCVRVYLRVYTYNSTRFTLHVELWLEGIGWTATYSNTQQHTAKHCTTMQYTAIHCNTLQHTATRCITVIHWKFERGDAFGVSASLGKVGLYRDWTQPCPYFDTSPETFLYTCLFNTNYLLSIMYTLHLLFPTF